MLCIALQTYPLPSSQGRAVIIVTVASSLPQERVMSWSLPDGMARNGYMFIASVS